ncbi:hydroxymethylglutaryl-CoA synthase [Haladaptatus litoreus]|uniref:Hydroxymethylglutaryl-CoA synthase n=1 Tax=Haladaptatus litoreus TaxID=553468 RepID=A0A1N6Y2P0_9EURY|nr:zinc ribbon domain-containing protein [Haladaptatus litoreus]SIR08729.1 hydroxymethylglutaryl-CoA synthase [Haladaptatus litoreus]
MNSKGSTVPNIAAVGAYAPRFRISADEFREAWGQFHAGGINEKAVPQADEDALTMAYEAGERALSAAGNPDVSFLAFASTTPPMAEEDLTARLGGMLGVSETATRHVFTGSTRAGTRALVAGLSAGPWEDGVGLVIAADCPRGEPNSAEEHAAGAGSAAFVLDDAGGASIVQQAEYGSEFPGTRFRGTGEEAVEGLGVTGYDRRAFSETLAGAVGQLDFDTEDVDVTGVQAPDGKLPYRAAGALGVGVEEIQAGALVHELGDTGAASVPLSLAKALAEGHELILAASFGSGAGADALLVEAGDVPVSMALDGDDPISYAEYLRKRGDLTSGPPSGGGAYVSVPSWRRTLDQRHRLLAGKCPDCGALNFPPEGACSGCKTLVEYDDVQLTGTGTIEAVTTISQGGAPPEFAEQQGKSGDFDVAIVALDGPEGDTASAPAQVTGADTGTLEIGDSVATTMRRIYTQEGVTRYGFKTRPSVEF